MLKITVATQKTSNETIAKDTVLDYQTIFYPYRKYVEEEGEEVAVSGVDVIYKINTWIKAADYNDPNIPPTSGDFKEYGNLKYRLTDEQLAELKSNTGEFENVFQGVQNILKDKIETGWGKYSGVGEGNVVDYTSSI